MFWLYEKTQEGDSIRYRKVRDVHLFGCNVGLIPKFLRNKLKPTDSEPHTWNLDMGECLRKDIPAESAIVIELKPNTKGNISLYELAEVFGYSADGWTPMLWRLRGLLVDKGIGQVKGDEGQFVVNQEDVDKPIFTIAYTGNGTVRDGGIRGTWNPTRPSSTNSALLWPKALVYFIHAAQQALAGANLLPCKEE